MTLDRLDSMESLYRQLASAGLDRKFVREVLLPEWWDDSIARNPAGLAEAQLRIARALGVSPSQVRQGIREHILHANHVRYKTRRDTLPETLHWATFWARRAAELAVKASPTPYQSPPKKAHEIREQILEQGHDWVNLANLLDYCWAYGIPILHLMHVPKGSKKMDGLVAQVEGRPAIVLSNNHRFSAWLLFILAHELGHWVLGHLKDAAALADGNVRRDDGDAEEGSANAFALELLTGKPDTAYWIPRNLTATELAERAKAAGRRDRVDPCVVVLNYAWCKGHWGAGMAAGKILEPEPQGVQLVNTRLRRSLDWSRLTEDEAELLQRLTGGVKG